MQRTAARPSAPFKADRHDAYALQDAGLDTYEANIALGHAADERDYTAAAQMLHTLGVSTLSLLSNNPDKAAQLASLGLTVAERNGDRQTRPIVAGVEQRSTPFGKQHRDGHRRHRHRDGQLRSADHGRPGISS